jgi:hypothetical protein
MAVSNGLKYTNPDVLIQLRLKSSTSISIMCLLCKVGFTAPYE